MLFKKKNDFKVDERLKHIAFIMDGNGRWAKKRMLPRMVGHKYGAENFKSVVRNCFEMDFLNNTHKNPKERKERHRDQQFAKHFTISCSSLCFFWVTFLLLNTRWD